MKLEITKDDGTSEVYESVTDYYLSVRQLQPMAKADGEIAFLPETRSYSAGPNVRELVKELQQSIVELQEFLRTLPKSPKE